MLQTIKKNNLSINEYVTQIKEYDDILLSRGLNITNEDILNHILDGLDSDYDPILVMLNSMLESKFDKPTLQDAQYHLQKHELRLKENLTKSEQ